ncbi:hypothetical protein BBO99_00006528 [Phytophthora kernoviae]|uniref:Uncharacterized protein n=1 Tax=Phytophthora kernoviae TaxID=325452 RepID=A0A3R7HGH0_9STRA|nr:hypothetical protein JM16_002552 [Phytophthora kernoviae]RLN37953.1 hypothetical protein BBI17_002937 [Phytophthora kernoviae]RLN77739.1 hypothetical protein BBO99_00006528 [Phytophthora kernoviae]
MGGKMGKHGKYKHGKHKGHKYKGHKYKGYKGKGFKKMGKKMKKICLRLHHLTNRGGRGVAVHGVVVRGVAAGEDCGGAAKEDHGGIAVAAEVARGGDAVVEGVNRDDDTTVVEAGAAVARGDGVVASVGGT